MGTRHDSATNATFVVNGAQVTADSVSIENSHTMNATGVRLNVGGSQVQADAQPSDGTVQLEDVVVTDATATVSGWSRRRSPGP